MCAKCNADWRARFGQFIHCRRNGRPLAVVATKDLCEIISLTSDPDASLK